MKRKLMIALFTVSSFFAISCSNDTKDEDLIIGKSEDVIKLSQKTVAFNADSNSITITSEFSGWWLNAIALNKVGADLGSVDKLSDNFVVKNPEFKVERKNGKMIVITMSPNTTNAERTLNISIHGGDYFTSINVVQAK